jgi:hypothetical protein
MRISEIDPNAKSPTVEYSSFILPKAPEPPKPPKAPTASKVPVKPKAKMIKPLPPDKAIVASLQQKMKSLRDRLKAVRQSQKRSIQQAIPQ